MFCRNASIEHDRPRVYLENGAFLLSIANLEIRGGEIASTAADGSVYDAPLHAP
jgi:hypothetical protein